MEFTTRKDMLPGVWTLASMNICPGQRAVSAAAIRTQQWWYRHRADPSVRPASASMKMGGRSQRRLDDDATECSSQRDLDSDHEHRSAVGSRLSFGSTQRETSLVSAPTDSPGRCATDWFLQDPASDQIDDAADRRRLNEYQPRVRRALIASGRQSRTLRRAFGIPANHGCHGGRRVQGPSSVRRPRPRRRGAGRPASDRRATRSSARSGDSGPSSDEHEPAWRLAGRQSALGAAWSSELHLLRSRDRSPVHRCGHDHPVVGHRGER
jgi:hypothetical protein